MSCQWHWEGTSDIVGVPLTTQQWLWNESSGRWWNKNQNSQVKGEKVIPERYSCCRKGRKFNWDKFWLLSFIWSTCWILLCIVLIFTCLSWLSLDGKYELFLLISQHHLKWLATLSLLKTFSLFSFSPCTLCHFSSPASFVTHSQFILPTLSPLIKHLILKLFRICLWTYLLLALHSAFLFLLHVI